MITICLLTVVCGITVVGAVIGLADRIDPWVQRMLRRIKRGLASRWLAEEGLTVTPLLEQDGLTPRVGFDEMMEIINGI